MVKIILLIALIFSGYFLFGDKISSSIKARIFDLVNPPSAREKLIVNLANKLKATEKITKKLQEDVPREERSSLGADSLRLIKESEDLLADLNDLTSNSDNKNIVRGLVNKLIFNPTPTPTHLFLNEQCITVE